MMNLTATATAFGMPTINVHGENDNLSPQSPPEATRQREMEMDSKTMNTPEREMEMD